MSDQSMKEAHNWDAFCEYAKNKGISLENKENYEAWWDCWKAGIYSYVFLVKDSLFREGKFKEKEEGFGSCLDCSREDECNVGRNSEFCILNKKPKKISPDKCPHLNVYVDTAGWHCTDCGESASYPPYPLSTITGE